MEVLRKTLIDLGQRNSGMVEEDVRYVINTCERDVFSRFAALLRSHCVKQAEKASHYARSNRQWMRADWRARRSLHMINVRMCVCVCVCVRVCVCVCVRVCVCYVLSLIHI